MGVPKFYRWLSERYPQINQVLSSSTVLPEFDNFYLDMNGIIHACTHPNESAIANSLSMREMILAIFRYIDRMVTDIVKPKKILFMAIDGVAPRAKLNQQRARRFRSAQDREESINKARHNGETVDESLMFDSNCITPGTEFMEKVSKALKYFIRKKIKEDPLWRGLKVIFSGHDVPGEGEHKIMQFIRELRADPKFPPNQRHCMYGQDADLIMLGLATHEPHFALLREVVNFNSFRFGSARQTVMRQTKDAQFQLLHLSILREYLTLDFASGYDVAPDLERIVDDFIFLTFLVGNDFLPHLPTLDISEHAFDVIIEAYRQLLSEELGYIVCNGEIHDFKRLESLFKIIGSQENEILRNREIDSKKMNSKNKRRGKEVDISDDEVETEEELQLAYENAIQQVLGAVENNDDDEWETVEKYKIKSDPKIEYDETEHDLIVNKDYRGRYYYEKYKVIVNSNASESFLDVLTTHYLRGLMWCLAYYIKGCISWTWYYPYHYGPMLQDMKNLQELSNKISFQIGRPFTPFQQLLGCLPPLSSNLLPKPYQWLMTSNDSPVKSFYPLQFEVDQNGKKTPWEAVVLLDFIDETRLLEAETVHCPPNKLSSDERNRNLFGCVLSHVYDPSIIDSYPSPNPEIGLADILSCQSIVTKSTPGLAPTCFFTAQLLEGTVYPIAGFPSLTILPIVDFKKSFAKINMFGSDSKYKAVVIEIKAPSSTELKDINLESLLDRTVYVNYPQVHEAKVVAVSNETEEYRLDKTDNGDIKILVKKYDEVTKNKWKRDAVAEETKYLKGRGIPGSGGLEVGDILIRLRVVPLQGLERNNVTGRSVKKYGTVEADVPIQLSLWTPPVTDTRFQESGELPVEVLMPFGAEVLAVAGRLLGCKGVVIGPHTNDQKPPNKASPRLVDVEFTVPPPEPPFGYSLASSQADEYFSSRDLCIALNISPNVLGKIVGSIKVNVDRLDIGLNLKRNGQYQLLGFVRRVDYNLKDNQVDVTRSVWKESDTIHIIGSDVKDPSEFVVESETMTWEYSIQAASLISSFQSKFPMLFQQLNSLPHTNVYEVSNLFGNNGASIVAEIMDWLKTQPFFNMPRTPFTTSAMSKSAMFAIEKASDAQTNLKQTKGCVTVVVKSISLDNLYCDLHRTSSDIALTFNTLEPKLGDRVANLTAEGVTFGLRGTVIIIHSNTNYVEVIFDEEFISGKSLQGSCSQFRGKLCPWSSLLLISRPEEFMAHRMKNKNKQSSAMLRDSIQQASDGHVKGQFPINNRTTQSASTKTSLLGNVLGISKDFKQKPVGPTVSVATSNSVKLVMKREASTESAAKTGKIESNNTKVAAAAVSVDKSASLLVALREKKQSNIKETGTNVTHLLKKKINVNPTNTSSTDSTSKLSVVSLLKKQLNINTNNVIDSNLDEPEDSQASVTILSDKLSDMDLDTVAAESNGTGRLVLAEAAGLSNVDSIEKIILPSASISHNPLQGVISYQAQREVNVTIANRSLSPSKEIPPLISTTNSQPNVNDSQKNQQQQMRSKKVTIDKNASMRIIKHELNIPRQVETNKKPTADDPVSKSQKGSSLLKMLKSDKPKKSIPAETTSPTQTPNNNETSEPKQNKANLLLQNLKKPKVKKDEVPAKHTPVATTTVTENPSDGTDVASTTSLFTEDNEKKDEVQVAKKPSKSISSILANAKKIMKSKQLEGDAVVDINKAVDTPTDSDSVPVLKETKNLKEVKEVKETEVKVDYDKVETSVKQVVENKGGVEKKQVKNSLVPSRVILAKTKENKL